MSKSDWSKCQNKMARQAESVAEVLSTSKSKWLARPKCRGSKLQWCEGRLSELCWAMSRHLCSVHFRSGSSSNWRPGLTDHCAWCDQRSTRFSTRASSYWSFSAPKYSATTENRGSYVDDTFTWAWAFLSPIRMCKPKGLANVQFSFNLFISDIHMCSKQNKTQVSNKTHKHVFMVFKIMIFKQDNQTHRFKTNKLYFPNK